MEEDPPTSNNHEETITATATTKTTTTMGMLGTMGTVPGSHENGGDAADNDTDKGTTPGTTRMMGTTNEGATTREQQREETPRTMTRTKGRRQPPQE
jgi:hypothetical protein